MVESLIDIFRDDKKAVGVGCGFLGENQVWAGGGHHRVRLRTVAPLQKLGSEVEPAQEAEQQGGCPPLVTRGRVRQVGMEPWPESAAP